MIEETQKPLIPQQQLTVPDTEQRSEVIQKPKEIGGPQGPEPTRYGDWEKAGRCIDF